MMKFKQILTTILFVSLVPLFSSAQTSSVTILDFPAHVTAGEAITINVAYTTDVDGWFRVIFGKSNNSQDHITWAPDEFYGVNDWGPVENVSNTQGEIDTVALTFIVPAGVEPILNFENPGVLIRLQTDMQDHLAEDFVTIDSSIGVESGSVSILEFPETIVPSEEMSITVAYETNTDGWFRVIFAESNVAGDNISWSNPDLLISPNDWGPVGNVSNTQGEIDTVTLTFTVPEEVETILNLENPGVLIRLQADMDNHLAEDFHEIIESCSGVTYQNDTISLEVSNPMFETEGAFIRFDSTYRLVGLNGTCYVEVNHYTKFVYAPCQSSHVVFADSLVIDVPLITRTGANHESNRLYVYPNPTNDILLVNTGDYLTMGEYTIQINNSNGNEVYSSFTDESEIQIDLSSLGEPGVYFLLVLDTENNEVVSKKVILN